LFSYVTVTALLLMKVLQESKPFSFYVYVCACMCRNEAKVLMKAQGSSAVGFKIITSVHKGNSRVCVCVCFGCKGLRHTLVNLNLSFFDVFSLSFFLALSGCMLHLVHHLSTLMPFLLIHRLSLSSLIQLFLSRSFYTSPILFFRLQIPSSFPIVLPD